MILGYFHGGFGVTLGSQLKERPVIVPHTGFLHFHSAMDPFGHLVKPVDPLSEYCLFWGEKKDFTMLLLNNLK